MPKPIIIIMGPTASGKTTLSLELAEQLNAEIISADSRQIYFGLNIGTDKIVARKSIASAHDDAIFFNDIPHYLIDILTPDQVYSAADFQKDAKKIAMKIQAQNKIPLVVGGTGFYVRAMTGDTLLSSTPPNPEFRAWAEKQTLEKLAKELTRKDPVAAARIDLRNPRRVLRALEIAQNPIPKSENLSTNNEQKIIKIAIDRQPDDLRKTIENRIDSQLNRGLVEEVQKLVNQHGENAPGLQTISYRELFPYLRGEISFEQARQDIITSSWHYAKRQMTWLKKEPGLIWIKTNDEARKIINSSLA
jgi:tRNA dimethylallyltransferase